MSLNPTKAISDVRKSIQK